MTEIYCNIMGQHDNLGDVVLRRRLIDALRPHGRLNILVAGTDAAYRAPLVRPEDRLFEVPRDWRASLRDSAKSGRTVFAARPGELLFSRQRFARSVADRGLLRAVHTSGGKAFSMGLGARLSPNFWERMVLRFAYAPFDVVTWRDPRTVADMGFGSLMPDWAFGYGSDVPAQPRTTLVVSLRYDRPFPSADWIAAVRDFADRRGLDIVVVRQVARDLARGSELAAALGGRPGPWVDGDFDATEAALRALYRDTAIVVSDRLHVLIIAATEGAVPACIVDHPEQKIGRHFDAIGYAGCSEPSAGLSAADRAAQLDRHAARGDECRAACADARHRVHALEAVLADAIG